MKQRFQYVYSLALDYELWELEVFFVEPFSRDQ